MQTITKIALDAMGGDNAPAEVVKGAVDAVGRTVRKEIEANAPAEEVGVKQLEKEIERSLHNG